AHASQHTASASPAALTDRRSVGAGSAGNVVQAGTSSRAGGRMSRIGEVWQLRHGDALLGEITITGEGATPDWLHGSFAGQSLFAEFAPLLTDEHDLYQTMTSEFSDETY